MSGALRLFIQDHVTKQCEYAKHPCQFCGELQPGSEVREVAKAARVAIGDQCVCVV